MYKVLSILLYCFVAVLFAQDQTSYKNALGWESGLSYRRYISNSIWVGVNVAGNYDNTLINDTNFEQLSRSPNDSIVSINRAAGKDTDKTYSGTIKIELGKEIFRYKKLGIDAYVGAGYTLTDDKVYRGENGPYFNETKGHAFLGIIGFEPKIFLWDRLSLGTQLGLQYTYTTSKLTYNDQNDYGTELYIRMQNSSISENDFSLFGSISLSSTLVVRYYF
jgi:hypothetical protein